MLLLVILNSSDLKARSVTITGRLLEYETGEPIIAAIILMYDSSSAFSDANGNFELIENSNYIVDSVQIKAIGYYDLVIKDVRISNQLNLNDIYLHKQKFPISGCRFGRIYNPIKFVSIKLKQRKIKRNIIKEKKRIMELSKTLFYEFEGKEYRVNYINQKIGCGYFVINLRLPIKK